MDLGIRAARKLSSGICSTFVLQKFSLRKLELLDNIEGFLPPASCFFAFFLVPHQLAVSSEENFFIHRRCTDTKIWIRSGCHLHSRSVESQRDAKVHRTPRYF